MATNEIRLVINATDNSSTALKALAKNINSLKKGVASFSVDTGSATSGVSTLNATVDKSPGIFSRLASSAKTALGIFGGYKIVSGIFNTLTGSISSAISRLDTMDLFERKMKILTGSPTDAAYALNEMKDATKGTAYGLDTAARAVQNFVTRGMSTQDATKSVETWMDAVAVYGNGTNEALTSVINALGKMRSKGTVEMRNINSMINAGINPVQLYAKATGQAASEVQEQLSAKTLRTEEFLNVVENALRTGAGGVAKVTGLAKEMATTWQATFDNMRFAINRGWASLIEGADTLLAAFGGGGLKGMFKNFGNTAENLFSGIGDTLKKAGKTVSQFYSDFIKQHKDASDMVHQTDLINYNVKAKINPDTGNKFREGFLGSVGNFAERMATGFITLANSWAKFKSAVAKGINQIAPQLGHLFGMVFGQGVTSATELLNVFLNWATLKIPKFFEWVQQKLQWLIDHWGTIVGLANSIFHGFMMWQGLTMAERGVLRVNSALETLNKTLGFFTGGELQLPTLNTAKQGIEQFVKKQRNQFDGQAKKTTVAKEALGRNVDVDAAVPKATEMPKTKKPKKAKVKAEKAKAVKEPAEVGIKNLDVGDEMVASVQPLSKKIGSTFSSLWGQITGGFNHFTSTLTRGVSGLFKGLVTSVTTSVGWITKAVSGLRDNVVTKVSEIAGNFGSKVSTSFQKAFSSEIEAVTGFGQRWSASFREAFSGELKFLDGFFSDMGGSFQRGFSKVTGPVVEKLTSMGANASASFKVAFADELSAMSGVFDVIGSIFSDAIVPAIGWVGELGVAFVEAIPMITLATAAIGALAMGLGVLNPGNAVSQGITAFFTNFSEMVLSFGQYAAYMIENFAKGIIANADQLREQGVNLVLSIVTGILTSIPNIIASGITILGSLIAGIVQVLPTLVYQGFMAIGQFIAGLISAIPNILQGLGNIFMAMFQFILTNGPMFLESGVQLIWNIIKGIVGMVGQICGAIGDLLQSTWNWIISGDALKMFQDVGQKLVDWMLLGLAKTSWGSTVLGWFGQDADAIVQRAEADGAKTGESYTNNMNETLAASPVDLNSIWQNANTEQNDATAGQMGVENASAYVDSEQQVLDAANVDADLLGDSAGEMVEGASTAGSDVGTAYTQTATDTINAGSATVGQAASGVSSQLNLTFDSAVVQEQATNFINTIAVVFTEQAPLLYTTMGNIGTGVVNEFVAKVNEGLPAAFATAVGLLSMFKMGIDEAFNGVRTAVNLGIQTLLMSFSLASESFYVYGQNAVMRYAQGFTDSLPLAVQTALEFKVAVLEQLRGVSEATYSMGVNAINAFHNGVVATQGIVVADFTNLIAQISVAITSQIAGLSAQVVQLVNAMMTLFQQVMATGLSQVVQLVSQKRNEIEQAFAPAIQAFGKMGAQMITNLAMGIQSKMGEAVNKTSQLVQALKETFEKGLGIHSPSDYMIWIGQMMLLGFMAGLTSSQMVKFVESIIGDMRTSFKNGSFVPDELVDYLGEDTTKVIDYLVRIGDNTIADDINGTMGEPAIITEAKKYVGYQGQGGLNGSSMFGLHYGNPGAWCVSFVRYCAEQVGVPFPATNYVPDVTAWAQSNGRWTMTPQPGYAAIFSNRHIELVADVLPDGKINYIGGNTGHGEVKYRSRGDATGFVALDGGHSMLTLKDAIQQAYFKKFGGNWNGTFTGVFDPAAGSGLLLPDWFKSWSPSQAVAQWAPNVVQVLGMLQQPLSLLKGVLWAINGESGGDPNSTYLGDINVIYGGSKGLLQTITPNFEHWKNPSLANNIYDPTQNIWTCLREMQDTYGGIANLINRKIANGKWSGYAVGTRYVPQDMLAPIHKGEAIIPANVNPYTHSGGDYLGDLVSNMHTSTGDTNSNVANSTVNNLGDSQLNNVVSTISNLGNSYFRSMTASANASTDKGYLKNVVNNMNSSSGDDYLKNVVATIYNTTGDGYLGELVNDMYINSGIEADTSGMTGSTYNNNNQTINIEAPINVTVDGGEGAQQIANNIAEEMHKALTRAIAIGNSR